MIPLALQNSNMTSFVDYACIHNTMLKFPIYVTWLMRNSGQIMDIIDELFPVFVNFCKRTVVHINMKILSLDVFPFSRNNSKTTTY